MTARQTQLIDAEIRRHLSLALATNNDVMKRSHMEVAEALTAALQASEGREIQWTVYKSAPPFVSFLRRLSGRSRGRCRARKNCHGR